MIANKSNYLLSISEGLRKKWPDNRSYTIVCHGHSIPCGYTEENVTKPFDAYPAQFHKCLSKRFPYSVINVIVSAIGGENSVQGAERFQSDVLNHKPDLIMIDYGRNDMFLTEDAMRQAWESMVLSAKRAGCKVLLISPGIDSGLIYYDASKRLLSDEYMAGIIRQLAEKHEVGFVDAYQMFQNKLKNGHTNSDYAISVNHLNKRGHKIIADGLMQWIPFT